ncbi:DUF2513 domain-containing protein [Brachyspira hyodysenteriae]|uniref:DUF2513 domain-containing protein n=1 Tax=Brachyspira hyodysenteriae TaxID=159 RepID=UPI00063DD33E|nr:DUF2513 domain-containing protein [Brachyspira hyodysenteriae]KLI15203.1 hypothetical protein SU46_10020 [Brachyspira hyodysenteriae]MCZ9886291.1 DUF2513 domain-containing protein [Brachyspira hyodysenteriae]
MKIDYQLIKNILTVIEDYPLPKIDGKELLNKLDVKIPSRRALETDEDYLKYVTLVYHMKELLKAECIENINKEYQYSFAPNIGSPFVRVDYTSYELTLKGSEFLSGLKQKKIFTKIKDLAINSAISLVTQLLVEQLK